jgi:CheY-like chemotaxis protein
MTLDESEILCASILIVDDQPANVRLLERLLQDAGYVNVESSTSPQQVAARHAEHCYDLILLDIQMPDFDGFEVIESLKALAGDDYVPVIALTSQPAHKLRALQAGAKDFISKPFDLAEVRMRIHNMLEVRLLYKKLARYNEDLERMVAERTAELRESERRFRRLTQLASDWYWEQDANGQVTQVAGPALEMVGIGMRPFQATPGEADKGWNEAERGLLQAMINRREPFLDYAFSRVDANGKVQRFRVSGEPMFNEACRFLGYRGIGIEVASSARPEVPAVAP